MSRQRTMTPIAKALYKPCRPAHSDFLKTTIRKDAMEQLWHIAALWLLLALVATLLSIRLRISTAPSEIVVGAGTRGIVLALFAGPFAITWPMKESATY